MSNNDIDTPLLIFGMFFMVATVVYCIGLMCDKCARGIEAPKPVGI